MMAGFRLTRTVILAAVAATCAAIAAPGLASAHDAGNGGYVTYQVTTYGSGYHHRDNGDRRNDRWNANGWDDNAWSENDRWDDDDWGDRDDRWDRDSYRRHDRDCDRDRYGHRRHDRDYRDHRWDDHRRDGRGW